MNVFIGLLISFTLGAAVACLGSSFLTRYEAFKAETVDKLKAERKDILALEESARANELQQMELNARCDKRLHQAEEAIATLDRVVMMAGKGRHETASKEGGEQ